MPVIVSTALDGITSFFSVNNVRMHVNNSVTVKTVGRISLGDGGQLEESEGYNYFSSFSMC